MYLVRNRSKTKMSWFDKIIGNKQDVSGVSKAGSAEKSNKSQSSNDAQAGTIYDNVSYNQGAKSIESSEQDYLDAAAKFNKSSTPASSSSKQANTSSNANTANSASRMSNSRRTPSINSGTAGSGSTVSAANISGNESSSQLRSSRSDALSQLSEAQAQKTNNDAVNQAKSQVEQDKQAYDDAVEQLSSDDEQIQAQIDDIKSRKSDIDSAKSDQQSQISDINSNISSKNSEISDLNSQLSGLVQPSQSDYMTTDEKGNSKPDSAAYSAAMAEYEAQKAAIEEQIAAAENELTDLQSQLTDAESQLSDLDQQASDVDQELSELLSSDDGQKIQNQQAVQDAMSNYQDSQQNLSQTEQQETAQIDANISQLQDNISAYDDAIQTKEQEEAQEAQQAQQNEQESDLADPLSIKVGDEEYTLLDSGITADTFNSIDNFLADKDIDEALEQIPGNKDNVLSFQELEDAGISVVDSNGNVMGVGQIRSEIATELGIDEAAVSHIGIDINPEMIENYENGQNQDLKLVDISNTDENGNYQEVTGVGASSTFEDTAVLKEKYNLSEAETQASIDEAKNYANGVSEEVAQEAETILKDAKILLNPDEYTADEVKAAAESVETARSQIEDAAKDSKADGKKNENGDEEFGASKSDNQTETEKSIEKLTETLKNLDLNNPESKDEAKSAMTEAIRSFNIENGVAPEVANAIAMAYSEIGVGEDYIVGTVSGDMEYPSLDANGNTTLLSKENGGIQANTGEMEKYGGRKGDAWCVKFLSWLYGDGQGINFSDKFSSQYADISVSSIRAEADNKGQYSTVESGYQPVPGDIMVLENNGASHVGMVINNDKDYVYTIEGNADNEVRAKKYLKSGEKYTDVSGYIRMNDVYGSSATPYNIDYLASNLDENIAHSTTATKEEKEAFLLAKSHEGTI